MRYHTILLFALPLLMVAACSDSDGITDLGAPEPAALVRFVNAVPDTGAVDFNFVDFVENLPTLKEVAYQSSSGYYQRARPGTRSVRIFPSSNNAALTSIRLIDTTVDLQENTRYTLVFTGRAGDGSQRLEVIQDPPTPPTPPAGSIALQLLHAGVDLGPVDVYVHSVETLSDEVPANFDLNAAAVFSNVDFLQKAADYVNVPVLAPNEDDDGPYYMFIVAEAGSTTPLFSFVPDATGEPAPSGASYGPRPGVQIDGSVLTAVVMNGAVPGTRQADGREDPSVLVLVDKVLNP